MIRRLEQAFAAQLAHPDTCLQAHAHPDFHVHDPPPPREKGTGRAPCCVLTTGRRNEADLYVRNPNRRTVHLVVIDHCLYDDSHPSKCDCALVSDDKVYFVEFKTQEISAGATAPNSYPNPGDCLPQLAASIRDFYDRGIIEPQQTVHAYASVGYPRKGPQHGAHHQDQLRALQVRIQEDKPRPIRLRYCSESELDIA